MPNYSSNAHPPNVAVLISRAVVDPALPMMIIDYLRGLQIYRNRLNSDCDDMKLLVAPCAR